MIRLTHAALLLAVTTAVLTTHRADAITLIVGPGQVDPIYDSVINVTEIHFLAGTEIISHDHAFPVSGRAFRSYYQLSTFDGGRYEGASATVIGPGTENFGGTAVYAPDDSPGNFVIHDGIFRGGSVYLTPSAPAGNYFAGSGFELNSRGNAHVVIEKGLFEGGVVTDAANPDPNAPHNYALAMTGRERNIVDVYGGTFVGGILISRLSSNGPLVNLHGSDFEVQPPDAGAGPINQQDHDFTVSGNYADGTPFSHFFHATSAIRFSQGAGFLSIDTLTPEPSAVVLAAMASIFLAHRRSRVR